MKRRRLLLGLIIIMLLITASAHAQQSNEAYQYFPSERSNTQLALTAQGGWVKMTYTPATYRILRDSSEEFVELEIQDALLSPGAGSEDVDINGEKPRMKLVFGAERNDSTWMVRCWEEETGSFSDRYDSRRREILVDESSCQFDQGSEKWSGIIRVYTGNSDKISLKIVWDKTTQGEDYKDSQYEDLINVFKLRSRGGRISLAPTDLNEIKEDPFQIDYNFKREERKERYEHSFSI